MKRYNLMRGKIQNRLKLLTLMFLLTTTAAFSQHDSLFKYLESATLNNPLVLQKFAEYQAALQKIPQAGSLQDPQLSLGIFLTPMELVTGSQVADITLMQMFPWFGVQRNARDEMSMMANAKFEEFRDSKLQVYYEIQRAWYELWKIRKNINVSNQNLTILKSVEKVALIRYKSPAGTQGGVIPPSNMPPPSSQSPGAVGSSAMQGMQGSRPAAGSTGSMQSSAGQVQQGASMGNAAQGSGLSDLYRLQIETSDLQNNIALLKNREATVAARFNSLLNRSSVIPVFTPDTLVVDTIMIAINSIPDSIRKKSPMLGMIEFEMKSFESRRKMLKGMGRPMIGLGLNYSLIKGIETDGSGMAVQSDMNGRDMIMPMVNFTLPVFRKKYKAMQKEASLLGEAALYNYEATANNLENEYYEAVQMYNDAKRRIGLYSDQYLLASRSLDILLKGFSTATSNLTDILRLQQQSLDYRLRQVEAVADMNTATAWLRRLMASTITN